MNERIRVIKTMPGSDVIPRMMVEVSRKDSSASCHISRVLSGGKSLGTMRAEAGHRKGSSRDGLRWAGGKRHREGGAEVRGFAVGSWDDAGPSGLW